MHLFFLGILLLTAIGLSCAVAIAAASAISGKYWNEPTVIHFKELRAKVKDHIATCKSDRRSLKRLTANRPNLEGQIIRANTSGVLQEIELDSLTNLPDIGHKTVEALRGTGVSSMDDLARQGVPAIHGIGHTRSTIISEHVVQLQRMAQQEAKEDFAQLGRRTHACSVFQSYQKTLNEIDGTQKKIKSTLEEIQHGKARLSLMKPPSFMAFGIATASNHQEYDEQLAWSLMIIHPISYIAFGCAVANRYGLGTWAYVPLLVVLALAVWPVWQLLQTHVPEEHIGDLHESMKVIRPTYKETSRLEKQVLNTELAGRINQFKLRLGRDFNGRLYQFQLIGAKFLVVTQKALLGDEMGLGKTPQTLAALVHIYREQQGIRCLLICPTSLIYNWESETHKFTHLRTIVIRGAERSAAYSILQKGQAEIGIISYETFIRDYPSGDRVPPDWSWKSIDVAVLDEAQRLRNSDTKTAKLTKKMLNIPRYRFLLTGTPLENRAEDFHSLTEALGSPLGDLETFQKNLASWGGPRMLQKKASNFYLRRKKDDVFDDLPDVIRQNVYLELTKEQQDSYADALWTKGAGWDSIMELRQIVNICPNTGESSKMEFVREFLLESREEGDKVIVFSFFLKILDELARMTCTSYRIDGSVKPEKRIEMIEEFSRQPGFAVILVQIRAGGTGLNLQAANRVLLFEPQWNPAIEEQAIARAHRIRQTKTVHAVRLLTHDTIEEKMEEVLEYKRDIFNELVDEAELNKKLGVDWKRVLDDERARIGIPA